MERGCGPFVEEDLQGEAMSLPIVVIGSSFGDEGKGSVVHSMSDEHSLVVRFNGGAQAGHTVIHGGRRHVFSSFGSGSLRGARTHLSRFFVCHPLEFLSEYYSLESKGIQPQVSVSPMCRVTTVADVMINHMLEIKRARGKEGSHGSVGVGFGETIERCLHPEFCLGMKDLEARKLSPKLNHIKNEWVSLRMGQCELDPEEFPEQMRILRSLSTWNRFMDDCIQFKACVRSLNDEDVFQKTDPSTWIFEGAQGLMLDEFSRFFPHVTRSSTGLTNVRALVGEMPLDVYYVTRPYTTRHGNGPLPHEIPNLQNFPYTVVDHTNVPNEYQGTLRFSLLDVDLLEEFVGKDRKLNQGSNSMVMTCLDQVENQHLYWWQGSTLKNGYLPHCLESISYRIGMPFYTKTGVDGHCLKVK